MNENKGKKLLAQFGKMVNQRSLLETYWKDAFRYTLPHRGQGFLSGQTSDPIGNTAKAKNDQSTIYDSTAIDAVRLLASSIISSLTPSNNQWFTLSNQEIDQEHMPQEAKKWLEHSSKKLFNMIHNSNYNAQAFEFAQDLAIGGMDGLYVEKVERGPFKFEVWSLDSLYVNDSLGSGRIDTVYRSLHLSGSAAAAKFGVKNLPEPIQRALSENPDDPKTYEFIHVIGPRIRDGKQVSGKLTTELPFESIYVCRKSGKIVMESGYHEFPVVIPRWSLIPGTQYAVGPLNDCLPDVKTLNKVIEMMLTNAEMAISGTFVAKNDGVINPNTIRVGPRRVIMAADARNIQPLASGGNFQIAFEEIARLQRQVRSVMMADALSPIAKDYASATEVSQRAQIIRQVLGPIYARLQSEFLQPLLERCFGLAYRDGSLGVPPEALQGLEFTPEYQSPMARAQKMEELSSIDQFVQRLAQIADTYPGVLDLFDSDAATYKTATLLGVPVDAIRSKEQVIKLRKQQQEIQQQQQMMEQMNAGIPES